MHPKISIITPTFNAEKTLRYAIESVRSQNYPNLEHIIVDGQSADGTLEICAEYPHLKVHSDKDQGQSDAMNIGFDMSSGEIIGYLNADDIYLPGCFDRILPHFKIGADVVVGRILYLTDDGRCGINDPKTTMREMLRHWEPDAFCLNPVGYFYRREVQAAVGGFNLANHFSMDLEFLLACSAKFQLTKVSSHAPLGIFFSYTDTKTAQQASKDNSLWTRENFSYLQQYVSKLPDKEQKQYNVARQSGYRIRRRGQIIDQIRAQQAFRASAKIDFLREAKILSLRILNRLERRFLAKY